MRLRSRRRESSRPRRKVEAIGPVGYVVLVNGHTVEHGLAPRLVRERVPALPLRLLDALLDSERSHCLDQIDRARPKAVEVAGKEGVRAAELAGPALRAVDVVAATSSIPRCPFSMATTFAWNAVGGMGLVSGHLHDGADLAAELVARAEAAIRGVAPLLDELLGGGSVRRGAGDVPCSQRASPLVRSGRLYDATRQPCRAWMGGVRGSTAPWAAPFRGSARGGNPRLRQASVVKVRATLAYSRDQRA